ncbi:MAG: hypothetical protein FJZ96_12435 [Chloroflexi bacterium]|nr:hypothetical protein [Chloroflexota bacterium]
MAGVWIPGFMICMMWLAMIPHRTTLAQQPTGSVPTVTGTPSGPMATVYGNLPIIRVYSGPSTYIYPPVGILLAGQRVPAIGKLSDGSWIQIKYVGIPAGIAWVYAPWVSVSSGVIPVVEAPPIPTPLTTPTIDPTLAAAFPASGTEVQLPTYTAPPPVAIPTFTPEPGSGGTSLPIGMVILGLALIGIFGAFIAFVRGR